MATTILEIQKHQEESADPAVVTIISTFLGQETVISKLESVCSVCLIQKGMLVNTAWQDFMETR